MKKNHKNYNNYNVNAGKANAPKNTNGKTNPQFVFTDAVQKEDKPVITKYDDCDCCNDGIPCGDNCGCCDECDYCDDNDGIDYVPHTERAYKIFDQILNKLLDDEDENEEDDLPANIKHTLDMQFQKFDHLHDRIHDLIALGALVSEIDCQKAGFPDAPIIWADIDKLGFMEITDDGYYLGRSINAIGLLVKDGNNDPNVVVSTTDDIFTSIKDNNELVEKQQLFLDQFSYFEDAFYKGLQQWINSPRR